MPERKPSTSEGRSLKRKVESKDVKLRNNKIVEKTITPRNKVVKKTIQKKGEPVKTVKKTVTKKRLSSKEVAKNVKRGAAIGSAIGSVAGGVYGDKLSKAVAKKNYSIKPYYKEDVYKPTTKEERMKMKELPKPIGTQAKPNSHAGKTYSGKAGKESPSGAKNQNLRARSAGGGAFVGGVLGAGAASLKQNKTVRSRTVNGVNKTEQRKNVSAGMKTMRSKRRGSKR
jgi:hypothetical protein